MSCCAASVSCSATVLHPWKSWRLVAVYGAVDQGPDSKHVDDLRRLAPTKRELLDAARWARTHDPSPGFAEILAQVLAHFGVDGDANL